jgi:hypothetical protein
MAWSTALRATAAEIMAESRVLQARARELVRAARTSLQRATDRPATKIEL